MTGGDRGRVGQGIYGRIEGTMTSRRMESLTSKSPTGLRNDGRHKEHMWCLAVKDGEWICILEWWGKVGNAGS